MNPLPRMSETPIEPLYRQSKPNELIDLGTTTLNFQVAGNDINDDATVRIRFSPSDRLEFICPLRNEQHLWGPHLLFTDPGVLRIKLASRSVSFDGFITAIGGDCDGIVIAPSHSSITATAPSQQIASAVFHVFNFPDFSGPEDYVLETGTPPRKSTHRLGRVLLSAAGWSVTIAATEQTRTLTKLLGAVGGHAITHVGQITRSDGSVFSSEQLDDILSCVQYFLSFALGRWAGVALPVGFDANGERVFEQWGLPRVAEGEWNGGLSWFDSHHSELLSQVFPGFVSLWKSPLWHEPLSHSLYWYLAACSRGIGIGVDAAIILAQTALESLAWTHCVMERGMVSPRAFKQRGLSASDKFRLLATSLDIPKAIPQSLPVLSSPPTGKWDDSMAAITEIRNSLVHANSEIKIPDGAYAEAWKLSLWIIELVLLRLCGHIGFYGNRLAQRWQGEVAPVPWKQKEPGTEFEEG